MSARIRVTPFGPPAAFSARGLLMGNRGCLHDETGEIVRDTAPYRGWVSCLLSFNGRKRSLRQPGRYTELFFLDEATALAAGHRPCGTCRHRALRAFLNCMALGLGLPQRPRFAEVDRQLHSERLEGKSFRRGWPARLSELPSGAMVTRAAERGRAWLWNGDRLRPWHPEGYGPPETVGLPEDAVLLTPPSIVAALRAGYGPMLHHTALATT